jgi:putative membrane protein
MSSLETILKAVVLGGLGLMFYTKLNDGTLSYYINQRFAWLSFVAVLVLAALAFTMVYRLMEQRAGSRGEEERGRGGERGEDADGHAHEHGHGHGLSWGAVALVALPMVVGLVVPARPLGAGAIGNRGIGLSAPDRPGVSAPQGSAQGPKNVLDWLREFASSGDAATLSGKSVDVVGFVYRDPRNAAEQFWVSRFTLSCCVADATAIGLLVQVDQARALALRNDAWVRVTGKFKVGEFAGEKVPLIAAERVEPVEAPQNPYLYP